jgi:hypothetical protein
MQPMPGMRRAHSDGSHWRRPSTPTHAAAPLAITQALDAAVVKQSYVHLETLPGGETEQIEFKSCMDRRAGKGCFKEDAIRVVQDKVAKYVCAFLNSSGGAVLFGVEVQWQGVGKARLIIIVSTSRPQMPPRCIMFAWRPCYHRGLLDTRS